jgi:hypothetical protein
MKTSKYLLVIGLLFLLTGSVGLAQGGTSTTSAKDYKYTIKINPLAALGGPFWVIVIPVTGEYKVSFEAKVAKQMSFQLGGSYIGPSVLLNLDKIATDTSKISALHTSGFRVSGMVKYFLSRDLPAPRGFYLAPQISYAKAKIADKTNSANYVGAQKLCLNACIGYQLITSGGFCLDIFTGMGYVSRKWDYHGDSSGSLDLGNNRTGVNIPLGFSFGYAF